MKFFSVLAFGTLVAIASAAAHERATDNGYYTLGKRDENGHLIFKRRCNLDGSDCPDGQKCVCIPGPDPCSCS